VRLDPVEGVVAGRLLLIIVSHRLRAPPSLSALRLEEGEDRLPGRQFESEVGRHAGCEVLGLMMDDEVDVSEADAQEPGEHRLGEGDERLGVDVGVPVRSGGSTAQLAAP
jgi:hypothetical protein